MALDPDGLTPERPTGSEIRRDLGLTAVVPNVGSPSAPRFDDDEVASDRRRVLWRDSATLLIGVIIAILAAETFLPGSAGVPTGSPTAIPSGVAIGSVPPPRSLPPGVTFGPIIDPSLGIDATPTPIPVITPTPVPPPTARPSPSPSPKPSATPRPSVRPSVGPSVRPSVRPSVKPSTSPSTSAAPTPEVTPAPPIAGFSWLPITPVVGEQVQFTSSSTGEITAYAWSFGDGGTSSDPNPAHVYAGAGTYTVRLTINGDPGLFAEHNVTVDVAPSGT